MNVVYVSLVLFCLSVLAWETVRRALLSSLCRDRPLTVNDYNQSPHYYLSTDERVDCSGRRVMNTSLTVPGQSSPPRRGGASGSAFGRGAGSKNKTWVAGSGSRGNSPTPGPSTEGRWERGGHRGGGGGRGGGGRAGTPTTNGLPTSSLSRTNASSPVSFDIPNEGTPAPSMNGVSKTWEEVRASRPFSFKNCHFS